MNKKIKTTISTFTKAITIRQMDDPKIVDVNMIFLPKLSEKKFIMNNPQNAPIYIKEGPK